MPFLSSSQQCQSTEAVGLHAYKQDLINETGPHWQDVCCILFMDFLLIFVDRRRRNSGEWVTHMWWLHELVKNLKHLLLTGSLWTLSVLMIITITNYLFQRCTLFCCMTVSQIVTSRIVRHTQVFLYRVSTPPGKSWIFFLENSRTWKVLENHFGPGKSWKLKLKVLEKYPWKSCIFLVVQLENKQQ